MKIIQLMRKLFAAATLALAASAPAHATLVGTYETLYFSGTCIDCAGTAVGTLWFRSFTVGTPLVRSNLFGFSYGGSNLFAPFSIDADDNAEAIAFLRVRESGYGHFTIRNDKYFFTVLFDGTWSTGLNVPNVPPVPPCTPSCGGGSGHPGGPFAADYGINGMFSDKPLSISPPPPPPPPGPVGEVPEPGSAFLLFLGFSAMAGIHRRRRGGRATLKAAVVGN